MKHLYIGHLSFSTVQYSGQAHSKGKVPIFGKILCTEQWCQQKQDNKTKNRTGIRRRYEMKTIRSSILCLVVLLLLAPLLRAQDLSKYRHFALGMSLTRVLNRTERQMADGKGIHGRPALIQELTWWPPNLPGASFQADTVEQMLFSFQNGELY